MTTKFKIVRTAFTIVIREEDIASSEATIKFVNRLSLEVGQVSGISNLVS